MYTLRLTAITLGAAAVAAIALGAVVNAAPASAEKPALTQDSGAPVVDNQNSLTAGAFGGVKLEDFHLIE